VLFVSVFSPGTLAIVTLTRTGRLSGGVVVRRICVDADSPAFVSLTRFGAVIVLMPVALTEIRTVTSNSSRSPWFWKLTVKALVGASVTRLLTSPGCSVVPAIATYVNPWPHELGQLVLPLLDPAPATPSLSPTVVGDSHVSLGRNWLAMMSWPWMPLSTSTCLM